MEHCPGPNRLTLSPPLAEGHRVTCAALCFWVQFLGEFISETAQPGTLGIVPPSRHLNRRRVAPVIPAGWCCQTGLCWGKSHSLIPGSAQVIAEITLATCAEPWGLLLIKQDKKQKINEAFNASAVGFYASHWHGPCFHSLYRYMFLSGINVWDLQPLSHLNEEQWRLLLLSLICWLLNSSCRNHLWYYQTVY